MKENTAEYLSNDSDKDDENCEKLDCWSLYYITVKGALEDLRSLPDVDTWEKADVALKEMMDYEFEMIDDADGLKDFVLSELETDAHYLESFDDAIEYLRCIPAWIRREECLWDPKCRLSPKYWDKHNG